MSFSGLPDEAQVSLQGVGFILESLDQHIQQAWKRAGSQVSFVGARLLKIVGDILLNS